MERILITGGAGFIGSHLAQRLLALGFGVTVLDNFDPFYDRGLKQRNLGAIGLGSVPQLRLVEGDIRDAVACRQALDGCAAVVHLAALAGVRPSIQDPIRYMDVNVTGTQTLLQQIDSKQVRFLFGGSSSVYGGRTEVPFRESDPVDRPISPYAASKRAGEVLAYTFHHLRGNDVICLRFFTVYGPRQRPEMAIHRFVRLVDEGQPLPFFGDGSSRRDYTFVDDIVSGLVRALERAKGYEIVNLGGASTTSLQELVTGIERAVGKQAILDRQPDQPGDVPITYADASKAEALLGYAPTVDVSEGLRRFCAWYRAERGQEAS